MKQNSQNSKNSNVCQDCLEVFVVDSLARVCEMKHSGVVVVKAVDRYKPELRSVKDAA
jgi:hypothetical protein